MRMGLGLMLLALGACGDTGADGDGNTIPIRVTGDSDYEARLQGLSELNRGLALRRAIQDSGAACKRVDLAGRQEAYKNMSMWTARCSDSGDWALFIAPNGDVQVRKCSDADQLGLPACRFEEPTEG
ncbi:hypothetical protein [Sphingosinicella rhizophila]|uniref:Uncharacterized protein n=1 Tax=Sphingosinicella rhizophila TaxID=3050082 RepID=A0ABU3Q779_9SPHN|nr:hypothetical protein [Sphingosinicella sp. GR2756]MDT9599251.1 hypothetical protein [Sphingosinicella sp. GR2756]